MSDHVTLYLVLGSLQSIPLSLATGLLAYVGVLAATVAGSQPMEWRIRHRQRRDDVDDALRRE